MKLNLLRRAPFAEPIEGPGQWLLNAIGRVAGKATAYLVAYRQAQAAEHLYEHLSRLSDADLARIGMAREDIMRHVRERLDQRP